MTILFNLGSISKMQIPPEWRPGSVIANERPGQISQPYYLDDDETITFATYYRGREMPMICGEYFKSVLDKPAHKVDADEYQTLYIVLRHMCEEDYFKIDNLYTEPLNGKMVLVADGVWLQSDLRNLGVFMPANADCTEVDELHYFAPVAKYAEHLPAVKAIMQSIQYRAER